MPFSILGKFNLLSEGGADVKVKSKVARWCLCVSMVLDYCYAS